MLDATDVDSQKLRIIEWQHLDLLKFYPMALATSCAVRGFLYPLNVVKARLQLQKQNNVYSGMRHAFVDIVRNEGMVALFRGFWVTMPQLGVSFIYSTIYEKFRNVLHVNANIQSAPVVSALAGGFSSIFTQIIFVPTDIISYLPFSFCKSVPFTTVSLRFSQHMMIYNNPAKFLGSAKNVAVLDFVRMDGKSGRLTFGLRIVRAVYHIDGIRGFYRGFFSSLMLYIPSAMVFWFTYYTFLTRLKSLRGEWKISAKSSGKNTVNIRGDSENLLVLQAFSGALGGICASLFTNPLEVLRVRIQVHRTNYWETIRRLYHFEGFRVFTKGLAPRMISSGINSCLILTGYEVIKRLCVLPEFRDAIVW